MTTKRGIGCSTPYVHTPNRSPSASVDDLFLRGTIVIRTCGIHKNLYIYPLLLTIFGPINYGPP